MATENLSTILHHLTRSMAAETLGCQSDRQLVEQCLASRDEAAFEAMVGRHGPMVYRVCRRVLLQDQDAEDAFQATFLVLAQKLHSVRKHDSLASWLHGVAHRVALKARAQTATRRRHERQVGTAQSDPPDEMTWREQRTVLDAELAQLPEKWRLPLILCYLEGRTQDEAAAQLSWSKNTFRRRLDEARAALGRRLGQRGVVWSAALSALLLSDCVASAALPAGLIRFTVEAVACVTAGQAAAGGAISARAIALTNGVLHAMFMTKLKVVTGVFVLVAALGAGAGILIHGERSAQGSGQKAEAAAAGQPATIADADRIAKLVAQLGSDKFQQRQEASRELAALGEQALAALLKAATDGDPETRKRAAELVDKIQSKCLLRTLTGHGDWVLSVAFSPDGKRALTGGRDKSVRLWDIETGKEIRRFGDRIGPNGGPKVPGGHLAQVFCVAFSPDGRQALSSSGAHLPLAPGMAQGQASDCVARLWDVETGKELRRFEGHTNYVLSVAFSPDGKQMITGSGDLTTRLWDVGTGKELEQLPVGEEGAVLSVAYCPDRQHVLFGLNQTSLRHWDLKAKKEKRVLEGHGNGVNSVAVSKDGRLALSGSVDRTVRLWDLATGKELRRFNGHASQVLSVAISPDGRLGVSGGVDKTVRLWDLTTGKDLACFMGHKAAVHSVAISPGGRRILSGSADKTVHVWEIAKPKVDPVFGNNGP